MQEKEPEPEAELEDKNYASYDPNDIYGPAGYGAANWIAPQEMQFQVVCENKPEENIAHAAMVTITQQIDAAFDYSTFRLGDMMIVGNYITVEGDAASYEVRYRSSTSGTWRIVTTTESSLKLTDMTPGYYLWQIRAADATGNMSDWSSRGQFTITGDMPDYEQYWADGLVFDASGNITGGYYNQYYTPQSITQHTEQVKLLDTAAETLCAAWNDIYAAGGMITLGVYSSIGIDSAAMSSPLWLSVGTLANGAYVVEQELLIKPDSAIHTLSGLNPQTDETYYIRVQAEEGSLGSEYAISVRGDLTDASHISANNSVAAATKLEASDDAEGSVDSWVGAGDALDYYCLEMAEDGRLSINLSGLEKNAKVRVYRQREDGAVTQTLSATAKAEGGLDRTLSLTAGTYFIEVAAYDNGAGRYNSTYALELEKEDESGSKQSFTIANA